ncbi:MAG: carboxypeptidase regulatory-like domain-containing protein [Candidatus Tectomicrobia bacterium]|uniref:Carboxypeptidase regulatory-like domain-containing protein n=1 Tax=Tectimicrobiota bacterium TaxID=2528274 RepID=A0A933GNL2_UNCTE|nr:carboxypeptidase regulatory-like domain-containing protein [Candidatus Tectomicrobia bacterium]
MKRVVLFGFFTALIISQLLYGCGGGGGGGGDLAGAPAGDLLIRLNGSVNNDQPAPGGAPDRLMAPGAGYIVKAINAATGVPYPDAYSVTDIDGKFQLSFKIPKGADSAAILVATKDATVFRTFLPLGWTDVSGALINGDAIVAVTISQQSEDLVETLEQNLGLPAMSFGVQAGVGKPANECNWAARNIGFLLVAQTLEITGEVVDGGTTPTGPATITGKVTNTAGQGLAGAVVTAVGTNLSATTDANGNYTIADVTAPGPYYLDVVAPAGYLDGETRASIWLTIGATSSANDVMLSARPPSDATFVGVNVCKTCHNFVDDKYNQLMTSAHSTSIQPDLSRMVNTDKPNVWPALNAPGVLASGIIAKSPVDGTTDVAVYMCNTTAYGYSMQFIASSDAAAGDCASGSVVKVSGTYGGVGSKTNLGSFKQRFLAKLSDVPLAASWNYDLGKDKDYLIMPVQVTQSGDGSPKLGGYKQSEWTSRKRTFARACSNCHNTGLKIAWTDDANKYITSYDYIDENITCERCHGPGSKHQLAGGGKGKYIVNPRYLTANAESQVCGQCHAADAGKSKDPLNVFAFAWNAANANALGGGIYVPGVHDISDYINQPTTPVSAGGGFDAWPDGKHGVAHRQQYSEFVQSAHANNPYEKLACPTCHNAHTAIQSPSNFTVETDSAEYIFNSPKHKNNGLCLACHSTFGPFAGVTKDDVAAINIDAGSSVTKNGVPLSFDSTQVADAKAKIGEAVVQHMNETAGMGLYVVYDPDNEPGVGRCINCHMPKTGKSGGYTTGLDATGKTALIEADQGSHVFDIIPPQVSKALVSTAGGADTKIMPNSCGKCHERYRYSAD